MEHPSVKDKRSGKVIFVSHCVLNQNSKVRGLAQFPGAVQPLVSLLLDRGIGIYQMPCPETFYLGSMRWGQVKDQYNNPMFRRYCRQLAEEVIDHAQNYLQNNYQVLGFIMVDGSPVCGLNHTPRPVGDTLWGGMNWYLPESEHVQEKGVFCEVLSENLTQRHLEDIPFAAYPELEEFGKLDDTLDQIKGWIK